MAASPSVRPPRQSRSRETLDRIVRAALELIEEQGVEGATVQEIVRRSGTSVGSFYHRFASRDALLGHLEERGWEEAIQRWEEAWTGGTAVEGAPEQGLEHAMRVLVAVYRSDFRVRSALSSPDGASKGEEGPRRHFRDRVRRDLRSAILASVDRLPHRDQERGLEVAFRLLLGGLRELEAGSFGAESEDRLTGEELVGELTRALAGYVGARAPGSGSGLQGEAAGAGEDVDPFEIWG